MSEELHQDPTQESEDDAPPIDPYQSFRDTRISEWNQRQVPILESAESNRQYYQASLENMQSFAEQFERKAEELRADIASKKQGFFQESCTSKKFATSSPSLVLPNTRLDIHENRLRSVRNLLLRMAESSKKSVRSVT